MVMSDGWVLLTAWDSTWVLADGTGWDGIGCYPVGGWDGWFFEVVLLMDGG